MDKELEKILEQHDEEQRTFFKTIVENVEIKKLKKIWFYVAFFLILFAGFVTWGIVKINDCKNRYPKDSIEQCLKKDAARRLPGKKRN